VPKVTEADAKRTQTGRDTCTLVMVILSAEDLRGKAKGRMKEICSGPSVGRFLLPQIERQTIYEDY